jgi:hypothetical protein
MNQEQMIQELAKLREENEKLKMGSPRTDGGLKITEKGGVSFYGVGRFPVTLYKQQWETLLAKVDHIREFLQVNADKLSEKRSVSSFPAKQDSILAESSPKAVLVDEITARRSG